MRKIYSFLAWAWILSLGTMVWADAVQTEASPPVRTSLTIYDRDFAQVTELRRVTLRAGENMVKFTSLPVYLDPASVTFTPLAGAGGVEVLEQQYLYDLADGQLLFNRYLGEEVEVRGTGAPVRGALKGSPVVEEGKLTGPLTVQTREGEAVTFYGPDSYQEVAFPQVAEKAYLEPTLLWLAQARTEGPQNLRLSYVAKDVSWEATYECILNDEQSGGYLSGRVRLENRAGGTFRDARVQLVVTEKGGLPTVFDASGGATRYAYGAQEPMMERMAASSGEMVRYELPRNLTLGTGETRFTQLFTARDVPIRRFYVYDGVRFDRFQRNRRNDWNYGTEYYQTVQTHIEFDNVEAQGLGHNIPPGRFRLYSESDEQGLDLVGEDIFLGAEAGKTCHVLLGPARGLEGERERTGYSEVTPLHEYEESFEIRLTNQSEEDVEIRVVEHLYRWPEYEIVRADTEYKETGPQVVEFRPVIKAGGQRSIHYTVRYSW